MQDLLKHRLYGLGEKAGGKGPSPQYAAVFGRSGLLLGALSMIHHEYQGSSHWCVWNRTTAHHHSGYETATTNASLALG